MVSRLKDNETGLVSTALRLDIGKRDGVQMEDLRVDLTFDSPKRLEPTPDDPCQKALTRCYEILNERLNTADGDKTKWAAIFKALGDGEMVAILNREIGEAHGVSFKRFIAVKLEPSVEALGMAMGLSLHELEEKPLN
jgi:hypothetical protein